MSEEDSAGKVYAVRNSEDFAAQSEAAYEWLEESAGEEAAEDWLFGLASGKSDNCNSAGTLAGRRRRPLFSEGVSWSARFG